MDLDICEPEETDPEPNDAIPTSGKGESNSLDGKEVSSAKGEWTMLEIQEHLLMLLSTFVPKAISSIVTNFCYIMSFPGQ